METIVIVSDVHTGHQVSGVGTWLVHTKRELERMGIRVIVLDAEHFGRTFPLPSYPEIRLTLTRPSSVARALAEYEHAHVHIATEGTLGLMARHACVKAGRPFTTSYHTRFPEYLYARVPVRALENIGHRFMRWFHAPSANIIVTTESLRDELTARGHERIAVVPLGVDLETFHPRTNILTDLPRPIFVYLGRLAPEKNVPAFLSLDLPGTKLVIGDGPERAKLEAHFPDARFVGYKKGDELAELLSSCDVAVFPSRTDTFGLTIIEAMACGLPVAAFDVQGPNDLITNGMDGVIGPDLRTNAIACLALDRDACVRTAARYSWAANTALLRDLLFP